MNVVAILGPTAAGKSLLAEAAAVHFGAEIVSVDSMQVYRGMDIGTAKPSISTRDRISHHMIDVADPDSDFTVQAFQRRGREALCTIGDSGGRAMIAGGSGLHFRSLVDPMTFAPTDNAVRSELDDMSLESLQQALLAIDHEAPAVVDFQNPRRLIRAIEIWRITTRTPTDRAATTESLALREYRSLIPHASFGIDAGEQSKARVEHRFDTMLADGLVAEVRALAPRLGRAASQAVGYKELRGVVNGEVGLDEARETAIRASHALVKRQRTYFRRDPRIEWMPWENGERERIEMTLGRIGEVTGWTS